MFGYKSEDNFSRKAFDSIHAVVLSQHAQFDFNFLKRRDCQSESLMMFVCPGERQMSWLMFARSSSSCFKPWSKENMLRWESMLKGWHVRKCMKEESFQGLCLKKTNQNLTVVMRTRIMSYKSAIGCRHQTMMMWILYCIAAMHQGYKSEISPRILFYCWEKIDFLKDWTLYFSNNLP